ncbi:PREDICTED: sodium/potassium/calcium exchanger 3-like [Priapulus caudatus]|uniref:Sodium/potassium/calcium exchanger 3-like n=1 Tax=Priapulus caudatus TaxID=37621 RepID=A0ABM1FAY1_PRICU|nr:PREDICTED: sodium/potassium/calcium exchanger 3-like [Priapulus caudatus]
MALAIICDDFFVPSLEAISEKLDLSEDVAGATFMAAGSSAPELFTSVVGVSVKSDVGVGTIVGSAVFNILIIVAMSAALSEKTLFLDWRPMLRDALFYALSLICFILFAWDAKFEIWEASILLLLYATYILIMKFNSRLMGALDKCCGKTAVSPLTAAPAVTGSKPDIGMADLHPNGAPSAAPPVAIEQTNKVPALVKVSRFCSKRVKSVPADCRVIAGNMLLLILAIFLQFKFSRRACCHAHAHRTCCNGHSRSRYVLSRTLALTPSPEAPPAADAETEAAEEDVEAQMKPCPCLPAVNAAPPQRDEETHVVWSWCKLLLSWALFIMSFPFVCMFTWTIPDCSKEHNRKWFWASFLMSVIWIAMLSFAMVSFVGRTGCLLGIDPYTMGLVVIAVGTSVPDCISSVLVARDGYGDMAVSNAIGSNVFDINLGIGLPFIIGMAIDKGRPIHLLNKQEQRI